MKNDFSAYITPKISDYLVDEYNSRYPQQLNENNIIQPLSSTTTTTITTTTTSTSKYYDHISGSNPENPDQFKDLQHNHHHYQSKNNSLLPYKRKSTKEKDSMEAALCNPFERNSNNKELIETTLLSRYEQLKEQIKELDNKFHTVEEENKEMKILVEMQLKTIGGLQVENNRYKAKINENEKMLYQNKLLNNEISNLKAELQNAMGKLQEIEKGKSNHAFPIKSDDNKSATLENNNNNDDGNAIRLIEKYIQYIMNTLNTLNEKHFARNLFYERLLKNDHPNNNSSIQKALISKSYHILALKAYQYIADLLINITSISAVSMPTTTAMAIISGRTTTATRTPIITTRTTMPITATISGMPTIPTSIASSSGLINPDNFPYSSFDEQANTSISEYNNISSSNQNPTNHHRHHHHYPSNGTHSQSHSRSHSYKVCLLQNKTSTTTTTSTMSTSATINTLENQKSDNHYEKSSLSTVYQNESELTTEETLQSKLGSEKSIEGDYIDKVIQTNPNPKKGIPIKLYSNEKPRSSSHALYDRDDKHDISTKNSTIIEPSISQTSGFGSPISSGNNSLGNNNNNNSFFSSPKSFKSHAKSTACQTIKKSMDDPQVIVKDNHQLAINIHENHRVINQQKKVSLLAPYAENKDIKPNDNGFLNMKKVKPRADSMTRLVPRLNLNTLTQVKELDDDTQSSTNNKNIQTVSPRFQENLENINNESKSSRNLDDISSKNKKNHESDLLPTQPKISKFCLGSSAKSTSRPLYSSTDNVQFFVYSHKNNKSNDSQELKPKNHQSTNSNGVVNTASHTKVIDKTSPSLSLSLKLADILTKGTDKNNKYNGGGSNKNQNEVQVDSFTMSFGSYDKNNNQQQQQKHQYHQHQHQQQQQNQHLQTHQQQH